MVDLNSEPGTVIAYPLKDNLFRLHLTPIQHASYLLSLRETRRGWKFNLISQTTPDPVLPVANRLRNKLTWGFWDPVESECALSCSIPEEQERFHNTDHPTKSVSLCWLRRFSEIATKELPEVAKWLCKMAFRPLSYLLGIVKTSVIVVRQGKGWQVSLFHLTWRPQ